MPVPNRGRLLPVALGAMGVLLAAKVGALAEGVPNTAGRAPGLVASASASEKRPPPAAPSPAAVPPAQCAAELQQPTPEQRAERELLQALRARREELEAEARARSAELDRREQALATREVVAEATEKRTAQRLEEASTLQRQNAAAMAANDKQRAEREEAGWRQMVKLYEGVRPREAAAIFDELDLAVLVPLVDRMREAKAAPVVGAMRPERARALTAELARFRANRARD